LSILLDLDLYHTISVSRILTVKDSGKWFGYGKVLVQFKRNGAEHGILLYLKKHKEFRDILERTIKHNSGV